MMPQNVADLEPKTLWRYFVELSKIPRESKKEQAAVDWIARIAEEHGIAATRDQTGNLLVRVPASPGYEKAPTVVLQGHVDMVWEKNSDVAHDFERDPIRPIIDGEWVTAAGTTLGADNGIGVATALAFLDTPDAIHGPLELLFTVDEETGLTGAFGIEPGFLSGRYMINLDSEEIGVFTVGCAGGTDTAVTFHAARSPQPAAELLRVSVSGMQGGHSGTDIHKNRGNSIKILFRLLLAAAEDPDVGPVRIGAAQGGSKRNALPREAWAILAVEEGKTDALRRTIERTAEEIRAQLAGTDDGLRIDIRAADRDSDNADATGTGTCDPAASLRMIQMMNALPHGVQAMSADIPDLVETSSNVGVLTDLGDGYRINCSSRSSAAPALTGLLAQIRATAHLAGAEAAHSEGYPGWKPNLKSPLLARAKEVHQRVFGKEAQVRAIHAGLECGLLTEKYPELDIISYGPDIQSPHSPDERVRIDTVEKVWVFTRAFLEDLAKTRS